MIKARTRVKLEIRDPVSLFLLSFSEQHLKRVGSGRKAAMRHSSDHARAKSGEIKREVDVINRDMTTKVEFK